MGERNYRIGGNRMNRGLGMGVIGIMAMSTQIVYGAQTILQAEVLQVPKDQQVFTVQLNLQEDQPYAGAEFGVDLSEGVMIKDVSYGIDQDYMSIGPVMNSKGTYYFGFFDGENKYGGDYTITMTLEKADETIKEASVSLKALNITRVDETKNVHTDKQTLNEVVTVKLEEPKEIVVPEVKEELEESESVKVEEAILEPTMPEQAVPSKPKPVVEAESKPMVELQPVPTSESEIKEEPIKEVIVPEKEIEIVETPVPYGKIGILTLIFAVCAFFVGRFTRKGSPKEDHHEHTL